MEPSSRRFHSSGEQTFGCRDQSFSLKLWYTPTATSPFRSAPLLFLSREYTSLEWLSRNFGVVHSALPKLFPAFSLYIATHLVRATVLSLHLRSAHPAWSLLRFESHGWRFRSRWWPWDLAGHPGSHWEVTSVLWTGQHPVFLRIRSVLLSPDCTDCFVWRFSLLVGCCQPIILPGYASFYLHIANVLSRSSRSNWGLIISFSVDRIILFCLHHFIPSFQAQDNTTAICESLAEQDWINTKTSCCQLSQQTNLFLVCMNYSKRGYDRNTLTK